MKNKNVKVKYVGWLLESAIENILLEQTEQQLAPVAPTEPAPQAPVAPPANEGQPPADGQQQTQQATMSLDDLIEKLNLIRGGRSFTDPEVYTKMGEVFKTFTDQQKMELENGLTKVIEVIVNPNEEGQPPQSPPNPNQQTTQQPPPAPTPASPTPQASGNQQAPIV